VLDIALLKQKVDNPKKISFSSVEAK